MNREDMFAELDNAPDVSSQQSYVRRGLPKIGADAMFQQMGQMPRGTNFAEQGGYQGQVYNTPPQAQPMTPIYESGANKFDMSGIAPRAVPMASPNGWRSSLDAEMGSSFPNMPAIDQRTGTVNRPMASPQPQQLTREQIAEFRRFQHEQRLRQIQRMMNGGMLSGQ